MEPTTAALRDWPCANPDHLGLCFDGHVHTDHVMRRRFALDVLWVIYTALTLVAVLIAVTSRTWDAILVACLWCYLRGRGRP